MGPAVFHLEDRPVYTGCASKKGTRQIWINTKVLTIKFRIWPWKRQTKDSMLTFGFVYAVKSPKAPDLLTIKAMIMIVFSYIKCWSQLRGISLLPHQWFVGLILCLLGDLKASEDLPVSQDLAVHLGVRSLIVDLTFWSFSHKLKLLQPSSVLDST